MGDALTQGAVQKQQDRSFAVGIREIKTATQAPGSITFARWTLGA